MSPPMWCRPTPALRDAVTIQLVGNELLIDPAPGFVGQFQVVVIVNDGTQSAQRSFQVSVTNDPPVLATIADQQTTADRGTISVGLSATDADGDPLVYSAQVLAVDPLAQRAYDLDQRYGLRYGGYRTNYRGHHEKYMLGNNGRSYYILPNGEVHLWYRSFSRSALVGRLSHEYYDRPSLLYNARQPGLIPSTAATVSVVGSDLMIDPRSDFTGSFFVRAAVTDGLSSDNQLFKVTVGNAATTAVRSFAVAPGPAASFTGPAAEPAVIAFSARISGTVEQRLDALSALLAQLDAPTHATALSQATQSAYSATWSWGQSPLDSPLESGSTRSLGQEERILHEIFAQLEELGRIRPSR